MKKTENTLTAIAVLLEENSHFAKRSITKDFTDFGKYNSLVENCLNSFYAFYSKKNNGVFVKELQQKSFESLSVLLHYIGKVNGAYIPCDVATVDEKEKSSTLYEDCLSFCWKFAVDKGIEIQRVESRIKNNNRFIEEYEKANTETAKKSILAMQLENETLKEELKQLYDTKDMAINKKTKNNLADFRKKLEKVLSMVVVGRMMLTEEEVLAEKKKKEEERDARRKQQKQKATVK